MKARDMIELLMRQDLDCEVLVELQVVQPSSEQRELATPVLGLRRSDSGQQMRILLECNCVLSMTTAPVFDLETK